MTLTNILLITILALLLGLIIIGVKIMRDIRGLVVRGEQAVARLKDTGGKVLTALDNTVPDSLIDRLVTVVEGVEGVETGQSVGLDRVAKGLPAVPVEGEA